MTRKARTRVVVQSQCENASVVLGPMEAFSQWWKKSGIKVSVRMLSWYIVPRKHSHTNFDSRFLKNLDRGGNRY